MPFIAGVLATAAVLWAASIGNSMTARVSTLTQRRIASKIVRDRPRTFVVLLDQIGTRVILLLRLDRFCSPEIARYAGCALLLCPTIAVKSWLVSLGVGIALLLIPVLRSRQRRARRARCIARELPMFVELLSLAVQTGLTLRVAVESVVNHLDGVVSQTFAQEMGALSRGQRFIDVVEACSNCLGDDAKALTSIMLSSERHGAPASRLLLQLAQDMRTSQYRQAERAARQLSVQLLFPVAGCVLPAFALLTAAPLLAGSIGTLASTFH